MLESKIETLRKAEAGEVTVQTVLARSVSEVLPNAGMLENLMLEKPLKLYLGIDPTSPDLHIGHSVPLRKLREFQLLGHHINLLFGTFTGKIGDPTDKTATRKKLTTEEVKRNVATYVEQAGKILDLSETAANPVRVVYNEDWLGSMNFADVVELAANFSVQQMLERSMFQERIAKGKPLGLHELLYPLMQGYDSVALGVDLEVGGKDQTFNMLVGRELVKRLSEREKFVMALKLIEDPNGKKMGKTEGNIVNVMDPAPWKYEALNTWPDTAVPLGFELLTNLPMDLISEATALLNSGEIHPAELKRALAYRMVAELDGVDAANEAELEHDRVYRHKQLPKDIRQARIEIGMNVYQVLIAAGLVKNMEVAKNLVQSRSVFVNGEKVRAGFSHWESGQVVSIGKRTIKNVRRLIV
jgi:tyrosyl-tRNA synthetase